MAIEFSTTSAVNMDQGVKALVYGNSGIGKTTLSATAPKPVIISAENGLLSLNKKNLEKLFGAAAPGISYEIPVIKVKDMATLQEAYNWCANIANHQYFETVVIDSISEIGEVVLNNAKRTVKDPRQAYGQLIEQMENIIRSFRDLPGKHVIMLAKEEWVKDEITGVTTRSPSMPGSKLGQKLPYFFDEVFRLATNKDAQNNDYRYLLTQPDLQNIAKDRSGSLDKMEMPHIANFINKILQGV